MHKDDNCNFSSATDSLEAIRDAIDGIHSIVFSELKSVYNTTDSYSYVTIIDVTGGGILYEVTFFAYTYIRITLDGYVFETNYSSESCSVIRQVNGYDNTFLTTVNDVAPKYINLMFKNNLKVEFKGSGMARAKILYGVV
jgi:hypothetical protein